MRLRPQARNLIALPRGTSMVWKVMFGDDGCGNLRLKSVMRAFTEPSDDRFFYVGWRLVRLSEAGVLGIAVLRSDRSAAKLILLLTGNYPACVQRKHSHVA